MAEARLPAESCNESKRVPLFITQDYFSLLAKDENAILKEVVAVFAATEALPQSKEKALIELLAKKPYPVLNILEDYRHKFRIQINGIISEALGCLISDYQKRDIIPFNLSTFNTFLANFPLEILESPTLKVKLLEALNTPKLDDSIYLALLSRDDMSLLDSVLERQTAEYWEPANSQLSKQFILHQAYKNAKHFTVLLSSNLTQFHRIPDIATRNNLLVLKIVQELSQPELPLSDLGNISKWLEQFKLKDTPIDLQEIHKFFYDDFQRRCIILDFFRKHPETFKRLKVKDLLESRSIIKMLYDHSIDLRFNEGKQLIESTYKRQRPTPQSFANRDHELATFAYYTALYTVYDIILINADPLTSTEPDYTPYIQQLNSVLRQIKSFDTLCSLLEDIFALVFLRWEHIDMSSAKHGDSRCYCSSESSESLTTPANGAIPKKKSSMTTPHTNYTRHGFICRGQTLFKLYSFLKNFVTKKIHSEDYKLGSERVQLRFQRIIDAINEALRKYSILEKIDDSLQQSNGTEHIIQLDDPEDLAVLVRMHPDTKHAKSSSDDDKSGGDRCNYTSLIRRKAAKKRRRATFSGMTRPTNIGKKQESDARPTMSTSISVVEKIRADPAEQLKAQKMFRKFTQRSIIPQMLASPENLATKALSLNNLNDVKHIIETFNLQNSDLNRELAYVEHQQQIRQKLLSIYDGYQKQELAMKRHGSNGAPITTLEQIKCVAAKGFEVSKIVSVIDNFALSHKMQQTPEIQQLLAKYVSSNAQYSFLQEFQEPNFNAILIADLLPALPINREIFENILNVMKRQSSVASAKTYGKQDSFSKASSQLPCDIGVMKFLGNLCECMRLLDDKLTLNEMLCDNYYSLKPERLRVELEREKIFNALFYKQPSELSCCSDLKMYAPLFEKLQSKVNYYSRLIEYLSHFEALLKLRDPNLEYDLTELLKMDPYRIIGELIFECNVAPSEIEQSVGALNINLVHVIASCFCPEIVNRQSSVKFPISPQIEEPLLNYVAQHNHLLSFILRAIMNGQSFAASNSDERINAEILENYVQLPEIEHLSQLYNGNKVVAVLCSDKLDLRKLEQSTLDKHEKLKILMLQLGKRDNKKQEQNEIDRIIMELIEEDPRNMHLTEHLHDVELRAKLLEQNFTKIATTKLAKDLIETTLRHKQANESIPEDLCFKLQRMLVEVTIYDKVSEVLQFEAWPQAYDFGLKTPHLIFERLLRLRLYKLCHEWCGVAKLAERFKQYRKSIMAALLETFLNLNDEDELNLYLLRIIELFPTDDCAQFFDSNKDKFRVLWLMKYVVDFIEMYAAAAATTATTTTTTATTDSGKSMDMYKNYRISIAIFDELTVNERDHFWHIFKYPLLILEQLIMNAKFEILSKILQVVRKALNEFPSLQEQTTSYCDFCHDKRGHVYDIHMKIHSQLGADPKYLNSTHSAFILLNFNLYQKDHYITNECIDLLLRIYATKALDYNVSGTNASSEQQPSITTDTVHSLDSLCGDFQMPKQAPAREDWIPDDRATHCMCCRRSAFTMLIRRHHCRRCGRVVCYACSQNRVLIPELYANVEVRICNDCQHSIEVQQYRAAAREADASNGNNGTEFGNGARAHKRDMNLFKWQLSGHITHDKVVREEFCYEHAPSVALCLSILEYHLGQEKAVDLLLYHCHKMERLIVPNPEVDFELIAKMMNCLALAAKVRGGPPEVEKIREHSEIILSVVQKGCGSLIPPGPLNNYSLRKLADSLVQAEHWQLALDLHLKCGFPTAGVMAAHGLVCLKAGCFDTAREKFAHCMPKLTNYNAIAVLNNIILGNEDLHIKEPMAEWIKKHNIPQIRRPQRGQPLLEEIVKTIQTTYVERPQPETLKRASIIRNSNSSIASALLKRKDMYNCKPINEPALNILARLDNLKRIAKGDYGTTTTATATTPTTETTTTTTVNDGIDDIMQLNKRRGRGLEECLNYILTYGSHADVLRFLIDQNCLQPALRYFLIQELDAELFIQLIFLIALRSGEVPSLIAQMRELDRTLNVWTNALMQTCRYLETQSMLNSLYQLQMLLMDSIRASMTCVKFYLMNCNNFQDLHANAHYLRNAQEHLESELDLSKWENLNLEPTAQQRQRTNSFSNNNRRGSVASNTSQIHYGGLFQMQMDARSLNAHINTIIRQLEVAKFLAGCEVNGNEVGDGTPNTLKLLKQMRAASGKSGLPTLFDDLPEKILICILILYCGKNIDEGFGLVYRIIDDYKIAPMKVYAAMSKYLSRNKRFSEVEQLINCITSNNGGIGTDDIDELLSIAINSAVNCNDPYVRAALINFTMKIHDIELKISSYMFMGQLKSAYMLANKYERLNDIKKIMRQAEASNQIHIKRLCERKLNMATAGNSEMMSVSRSSTSSTLSGNNPTSSSGMQQKRQ